MQKRFSFKLHHVNVYGKKVSRKKTFVWSAAQKSKRPRCKRATCLDHKCMRKNWCQHQQLGTKFSKSFNFIVAVRREVLLIFQPNVDIQNCTNELNEGEPTSSAKLCSTGNANRLVISLYDF